MQRNAQDNEPMEEFTRIDALTADDSALLYLGHQIAKGLDQGNFRIVDLNNIIDGRYIRVLVVRASEEEPQRIT